MLNNAKTSGSRTPKLVISNFFIIYFRFYLFIYLVYNYWFGVFYFWWRVQEHEHGVSSLKTLGSLGDSLYEVPTYNAFCAAMRAFQKQLEQNKPKRIAPSLANDYSATFRALSEFVQTSPEWKALANHVSIGKSREETSWILNGLAEGLFRILYLTYTILFLIIKYRKSNKI